MQDPPLKAFIPNSLAGSQNDKAEFHHGRQHDHPPRREYFPIFIPILTTRHPSETSTSIVGHTLRR
jgi:hypothetical protein